MHQKSSLTPAQIQYLKIGPKVRSSLTASRKLQDSLNRFEMEGADDNPNLANIPKFSFGNFENTVSNFGVLLHRNFVGTTSLHQAQKFGNFAYSIDHAMQDEKDRPSEVRKGGQKKSFLDSRIALKGIYEHNGNKLLVTLKSFALQSLQTNRVIETLPLAYLKLITAHVPSAKLVKTIESSMKQEGSSLVLIDFQKMESKVSHFQNSEERYSEGPHLLEKAGQQFSINLPCLQVFHSQSDYRVHFPVDNKDILEMLDSDMDNIQAILKKYIDFANFESRLHSQSQK